MEKLSLSKLINKNKIIQAIDVLNSGNFTAEEINDALLLSVDRGEYDLIIKLVEHGADINTVDITDEYGDAIRYIGINLYERNLLVNPMILAIILGDIEIINLVIELGGDLRFENYFSLILSTIMEEEIVNVIASKIKLDELPKDILNEYFTRICVRYQELEIAQKCIDLGANIDFKYVYNINEKIYKYIIENNIDVKKIINSNTRCSIEYNTCIKFLNEGIITGYDLLSCPDNFCKFYNSSEIVLFLLENDMINVNDIPTKIINSISRMNKNTTIMEIIKRGYPYNAAFFSNRCHDFEILLLLHERGEDIIGIMRENLDNNKKMDEIFDMNAI